MLASEKRGVLCITSGFPPRGGSGGQRMVKFVKHLGAFGWQPTVVTRRPSSFEAQDKSLLDDIPPQCRVYWTKSWDPASIADRVVTGRRRAGVSGGVVGPEQRRGLRWKAVWDFARDWVLSPHPFWLWLPEAYRVAAMITATGDVDVLLADSRISSVLALWLHRRFGIPYVVDYRNAWLGDPHLNLPTPLHRAWNRLLEGMVLEHASAAVFLDPSARDFTLRAYSMLSPGRAFVISNGYDRDDFPTNLDLPKGGPFTLGYIGSLYEHYTSGLRVVCEALRRMRDLGRSPDVRFLLVGRVCGEAGELVRQYGLSDVTTLTGYVDHREAIRSLVQCHALLLLLDQPEDGKEVSIPGKLYEYVAARRKILFVGPPCTTSSYLETHRLGVWSNMDVERVCRTLLEWKTRHERGELELSPAEVAAQCERRVLAKKLAAVLSFAAEPGGEPKASAGSVERGTSY